MRQRNTRQRTAIRAVFLEHDRPLGAHEVLALAQREVSGLGIATVYRTIRSLIGEGWLTAVELPGEAPRYEVSGKGHHHHFHCTVCGKVFEIPGCPGDLQRIVPAGFRLSGHEVLLYGRCRECGGGGSSDRIVRAYLLD